ncbi:sugar ABC transporter substrate-binding protein [Solihabitans fulvus]|uniref:Sugar ABC transporter substrate-binding protein n=1 Tax=Solihabitans fulvus TaxID=1892852 RepID=A0A5B2X0P9_9PSEU|nr:sugar ABC transporter substrate-binding protein [Solihabitans fulvus]KAA2255977.1 sugar ABC transporter substrate-binding protein [Solihabitans fulvus]
MRRPRSRAPRLCVTAASTALLLAGMTACGGPADSTSSPTTLTYWASNQGTSLDNDKQVLQPELDRFQQETGIKVNLEVVPWSDLLNRILAAATSGQGPDVLNIGNTWSASLQATGALLPMDDAVLDQFGGRDRFLQAPLAAAGAAGKPPTAVPLYSLGYGLYYNPKMFAAAGISAPPTTWDELVADGRKLTHDGQWGLAVEGASTAENAHHAFILGQQQGGSLFDANGAATFDSPQQTAAVKQYIDLMASDKIVNPSNAEYGNGTEAVKDFATRKAAMLMWQAAKTSLTANGMGSGDYGVAPIPFPANAPTGGKHVNSMVAGINLAIFGGTRNKDGALKFVKFMTNKTEQTTLNKTYGSLPPVKDAYDDPAFSTPEIKTFQQVLATTAAPLPQVPQESQFETLVGAAMKDLFADAASGRPVTTESVKAKLTQAQQQMPAPGH